MEKLLRITIFFFLFVAACLSDCPLNPYPRQTLLGHINAQINNDPQLHRDPHNYSYPLTQQLSQIGLNVATGIVGFQFNPEGFLNFSINYDPIASRTALYFIVRVFSQNYQWKMLRFNFFASKASLFQIGEITASQFSAGPDKNKYIIYRQLPSFEATDPNQIQIKIFIGGLELKSRQLGQQYDQMLAQYEKFKKFSTNYNLLEYFRRALQIQKSISLKVSAIKNIGRVYTFTLQSNSQLTLITYSYLIFNKKEVAKTHNYISSSFGFVNADFFKFSSIQNMDMFMTGLTGFRLPRQSLYQFSLQFSNPGGESVLSLISNFKYLQLFFTYTAFQLKTLYVCSDCLKQPIIFQNKMCVQECPSSYGISESLGTKFCDKCDIDKLKVVDQQTGKCVCAKRHYLQSSEGICKPCGYDCMTCQRADKCLTCDNSLLQTKRKLSNDGRCKCPPIGFYDDKFAEDIVCQRCDAKCLTCNGPKPHNCLTCLSTRQRDSLGFCVCKNGYIEDFAGNCVCPPPRIQTQNNFCIDFNTSDCGLNKTLQFVDLTRRCVCKSGYITVLDSCIKCASNAIFNAETLKCECPSPTIQKNGECVNCDSNKEYDDISKTCICKQGTFENSLSQCKSCPPKMVLINDICQCAFNYYEETPDVCKRCRRDTDGPRCKRNIF